MEDIGESLTRKLGPLPVWVWAIGAGIILYLFRSRSSAGSNPSGTAPNAQATAAEAQLVQAEAAARASTMQSPVTVSPGDQVYDPNTGGLLGGGGANNTLNDSLVGLIASLVQPTSPPAAAAATKTKTPALRGKGAIRAPSGSKPTTPKGYKAVGLGNGFWEFLPVKPKVRARTHAKVKPHTTKPKAKKK